jgi:hypothetical protein
MAKKSPCPMDAFVSQVFALSPDARERSRKLYDDDATDVDKYRPSVAKLERARGLGVMTSP